MHVISSMSVWPSVPRVWPHVCVYSTYKAMGSEPQTCVARLRLVLINLVDQIFSVKMNSFDKIYMHSMVEIATYNCQM